MAALDPLVVAASPFAQALPREDSRTAVWVRPQVVVEVKFAERTRDGRLRFPRFLRLRSDKAAEEVVDE
jgi:bifunctional non-homologous end joining protein LigD